MHYDHQRNIVPVKKKKKKKERKDLPARLAEHNWTHNPPAATPLSANTAFVQHHGQQPRSSKTYQGLCQHASRDFRSVLTLVVGHQADTSVGRGHPWPPRVEFTHSKHFFMAQKCKEFAWLAVGTSWKDGKQTNYIENMLVMWSVTVVTNVQPSQPFTLFRSPSVWKLLSSLYPPPTHFPLRCLYMSFVVCYSSPVPSVMGNSPPPDHHHHHPKPPHTHCLAVISQGCLMRP